jgi:CRP/FNR family transcriptional activator FtrB
MEPEALDAFPLFLDLEPETRRALATSAVVRTIAAGDFLFREGEPARSVHVLLDGMVELSLAATRSGCSVMIFTGGDVFLPAAALFEEPYLASGRALSESRVLVMDADRLRELAKNDAGLAMELLRLVSGQWRMAVRHILDLKCRAAPERLGAFLLRLADNAVSDTDARLPISKRHLAGRVGMTAETLSRALQTLADNGLYVRGRRIIIKDRAKAEAFCGPDPYPNREDATLGVNVL